MTPYLSSSIVRNRFGNRIFAFERDESDISKDFEIFVVVTRSRALESGHYLTYLRLTNQWYKFDDSWITEVDEGIVRASQYYMIFYVQKMIYYKSNENLNCLPISPYRETFHPIGGCCLLTQYTNCSPRCCSTVALKFPMTHTNPRLRFHPNV